MSYYWQKVLKTAGRETISSFGWNKKTLAAVLTALGTVIVAGLRGDLSTMTSSASGYFWLALAPFLAALVLFIWSIIETQAQMYADLSAATAFEIHTLKTESRLASARTPNYGAWSHVDRLSLKQAAFLWSDEEPGISMSKNVTAWYYALSSAIQKGELKFEPHYSGPMSKHIQYDMLKKNPNLDTVVTRSHLKEFASIHNYTPNFLKDS
ncbi:hypothetical protein [Pseudolabrys sp. FHR47]|uniref:hypothetical protein n=1 Tax=Pseudolabrys sp. FHR47 TaxID=2562284 RepID=UPI0010BEB6CE|nr:hypothetical protein [Pseudolabrys sp. FHR47]